MRMVESLPIQKILRQPTVLETIGISAPTLSRWVADPHRHESLLKINPRKGTKVTTKTYMTQTPDDMGNGEYPTVVWLWDRFDEFFDKLTTGDNIAWNDAETLFDMVLTYHATDPVDPSTIFDKEAYRLFAVLDYVTDRAGVYTHRLTQAMEREVIEANRAK
jgi:hypothetical protein